jgi:hypothetical protein
LEDFFGGIFKQAEGIVRLGNIGLGDKLEINNKLVISLLSIERDTAQGITGKYVRNNVDSFNYNLPAVNVNLNVIFAAVYDNKRYSESLSIISACIMFLQSNPIIELANSQSYTIEFMNLSTQELNNIWTSLGGCYYPSVVCKIRKLVFDAEEIKNILPSAGEPQIDAKKM